MMNANELISALVAETRQLIGEVNIMGQENEPALLQQPVPGKWSVVQVLEHLNSYDRYYLREIEKALQQDKPAVAVFKPGWLGNYFTNMMKPKAGGRITNKMQSPKDHRPVQQLDAKKVLHEFINHQERLLQLLEEARSRNIGHIRVPISISRFIKLKLGDTFRFLAAHKQRHFVQIENTLAAVKGVIGKYPANLPATAH